MKGRSMNMNFIRNSVSQYSKAMNIWEVLKDHNIADLGQLLDKP